MATPFHLELVTPERVLFSGEVEEISMRTDEGEIAFLAHHEDFVGAADITVVTLSGVGGTGDSEGATRRAAVHGGFVHVDESGVKILAGVAELAEEIDVDRARRALEAADARAGTEQTTSGPTEAGVEAQERLVGAMLALLAPESAEAARRRARARLEATGALATS